MNILSRIRSAAFALAFVILSPALHAVSEAYVPADAKFVFFIDAKRAVASPALKTILSADGADLAGRLDEIAMVRDDLNGDVTFFLTGIDPADFKKSVMDVVLYAPGRVNAIYRRIAARKDIKTEASVLSGVRILKIHVVNGKTDMLAFLEFVSDDILQCRLAINLPDTQPFIREANPDTPRLVSNMKLKGAIVSVGTDAAYLQGRIKAQEESRPRTEEDRVKTVKAGGKTIEIDEDDPDIESIRNNVKAVFTRITEGSRGSLDATVTIRCTGPEIRDTVFRTVDNFVTMYNLVAEPAFDFGKDGKLIQKHTPTGPLSTLTHEPKGYDAVFSLNLSDEFLHDLAKSAANSNKKNSDKKKQDK